MQLLNKTEQIAALQGKDKLERQNAVQDMLIACRLTPHPATGVSPYEAMRGATVRTRLDHINPETQVSEGDCSINQKDSEYKQRMKQQREGRHTRETKLLLGDYVLVRQTKKNKWSTPYEPVLYTVSQIQGSRITARRITDRRTVCRDASQYKLVNNVINTTDEHESQFMPNQNEDSRVADQNHRGELLRSLNIPDDSVTPVHDAVTPPEGTEPVDNHQGQQRTRPRRERRIPAKFKDFVMK